MGSMNAVGLDGNVGPPFFESSRHRESAGGHGHHTPRRSESRPPNKAALRVLAAFVRLAVLFGFTAHVFCKVTHKLFYCVNISSYLYVYIRWLATAAAALCGWARCRFVCDESRLVKQGGPSGPDGTSSWWRCL